MDTKKTISLAKLENTIHAGRAIASQLVAGDVVLLKGTLGAGKTELARAMIRALTSETTEVTSPTYTLMQSYDVTLKGCALTCWHIDLYRLESPDELLELGMDEILFSGLLLMEWPERLGEALPYDHILCELALDPQQNKRTLTIQCNGATADRADALFHLLTR